jgi:hypothetical protein
MFTEFKFNDVVYNNLSEKTRQLLDEKVPRKGYMTFRRSNVQPFIARVVPEDNPQGQFMMSMIGAKGIQGQAIINDPFTKEFVKLINVVDRAASGEPREALLSFQRGHHELEIDCSTNAGRQSCAMFFLLDKFQENILEAGKPMANHAYEFQLADPTLEKAKQFDAKLNEAEMIIEVSKLRMEDLQLLARATGYAKADTAGEEFLKVWIEAKISSPESKPQVDEAFNSLALLRVERVLRRGEELGFIYRDEAAQQIKFKNGTPIIDYNLKVVDQIKNLAEIFADGKNKDRYEKVKAMVERVEQDLLNKSREAVDELFDTPIQLDEIQKEKRPRTEAQLAHDRRLAEGRKAKQEETVEQ